MYWKEDKHNQTTHNAWVYIKQNLHNKHAFKI